MLCPPKVGAVAVSIESAWEDGQRESGEEGWEGVVGGGERLGDVVGGYVRREGRWGGGSVVKV